MFGWKFVFLAAAALFLFGQAPASAAPSQVTPAAGPAEKFLRASEALYEASIQEDAPRVRQKLRETEDAMRALPMTRIASAEGVEALARSVARMKRAAASVSGNSSGRWAGLAAEIRLAADALAHPRMPLWHRYRTVVGEDVNALARELEQSGGTSPAALGQLERLQDHYRLIRTAALLQSETFAIERADSVLRYAERLLAPPGAGPGLMKGLIPSVREAMEGLFPPARQAESALILPAAGPSWGWTAVMGGFIVTVLSWAGWLRYRNIEPVTLRGSLPRERRGRR